MTNRIILAAEVRVDDLIYNGAGTSAHPAHAWETITEVGGGWRDFLIAAIERCYTVNSCLKPMSKLW